MSRLPLGVSLQFKAYNISFHRQLEKCQVYQICILSPQHLDIAEVYFTDSTNTMTIVIHNFGLVFDC